MYTAEIFPAKVYYNDVVYVFDGIKEPEDYGQITPPPNFDNPFFVPSTTTTTTTTTIPPTTTSVPPTSSTAPSTTPTTTVPAPG
jgi:hypothetical protein